MLFKDAGNEAAIFMFSLQNLHVLKMMSPLKTASENRLRDKKCW